MVFFNGVKNLNYKKKNNTPLNNKLRSVVAISLFSAVIAVCSFIYIPFTVPFTMQLFGVFCSLYLLGGKKGTLSILLYIFIGAIGLPVFAGFRGGVGSLLDATGGFITGFVFSGLAYWLSLSALKEKKYAKELSLVASLLVCYLCGALYFTLFYSRGEYIKGFGSAIITCVLPFIIPDLLKLLLAISVCRKIQKSISFDL